MTYALNLIRSRVAPQTIASETAQNTNWKNMNAAGLIEYVATNGMLSPASSIEEPTFKKNPCVPAISPSPPKASAKPTAQ